MQILTMIRWALLGLSASVSATAGNWKYSQKVDPIDDRKRAVTMVEGNEKSTLQPTTEMILNTAPADVDASSKFLLVVKCDFGRSDVYTAIFFPRGFSRPNSVITYRFDKNEPVTVDWHPIKGGAILALPEEVKKFALGAMSAKTIAFRVVTGDASETTTFDGTGSGAAITNVYRTCGSSLRP